MRKTFLACWMVVWLTPTPVCAVEMKPETAASFDRYIRAVERRMDDDISQNRFLAIDRLADSRRRAAYDQVRRGQLYVEALHAREDDRPVHVQAGLLNHWVGVIFIPRAKLSDVISVLQDYDHHFDIYKPQIRRSKLIARHDNESTVYLQLFSKSIVTVVLNADFLIRDTPFGTSRHQIGMRSTRIAELANPDGPDEHELPVGNDHGYLWRFHSYWRLEEKDGGVYAQNESVALSRAIPAIFSWLFSSLTNGIPRDILTHLLTATRSAVAKAGMSHSSPRPPQPEYSKN